MGLAGDLLLSENPSLRTDSAAVPCVYVFFTHAHDDHICDAFTMGRLHCATLVATCEIAANFATDSSRPMVRDFSLGGGIYLPWGRIQLTPTSAILPSTFTAAPHPSPPIWDA